MSSIFLTASSVMAASVCSNHSSNTETQFKLVRLSTGVAGLTCDIPEAESTALSETSVSVDRDVDFNSSKIAMRYFFSPNFTYLSEIIE